MYSAITCRQQLPADVKIITKKSYSSGILLLTFSTTIPPTPASFTSAIRVQLMSTNKRQSIHSSIPVWIRERAFFSSTTNRAKMQIAPIKTITLTTSIKLATFTRSIKSIASNGGHWEFLFKTTSRFTLLSEDFNLQILPWSGQEIISCFMVISRLVYFLSHFFMLCSAVTYILEGFSLFWACS